METFDLYGGNVTLKFSPGNHRYYVDVPIDEIEHESVPSATGIVGVLDKPALMYWAVNETVDFLEEELEPGRPYDEVELTQLLEASKKARFKTSGKATTIGSIVHDWMENYVNKTIEEGGEEPSVIPAGEAPFGNEIALPYNSQAVDSIQSFLDWTDAHDVEWIVSEKKIYSLEHSYAGTYDAEAYVDGKLSLIDFKTSKGIYADYLLQLACYVGAAEEERRAVAGAEDPEQFDQMIILRVPKTQEGFETKIVSDRNEIEEHYNAFLSCLTAYKWKKKYD